MAKSMPEDGMYVLVRRGGADHLILSPPNVRIILEPLMGTSVRDGASQYAEYPSVERRVELYEKALDVVERWYARPDHAYVMRDSLFVLALYRRQVSATCSIAADVRLFALAKAFEPKLTTSEWTMFEERMPEGTLIQTECRWERGLTELSAPEMYAAE